MADEAPEVSTSQLQDTPAWSPARLRTIRLAEGSAMGMILLGALGNLWHMDASVAPLLIQGGQTLLLGAMTIHIGGASTERVAGWFATFKGKGA